MRVASEDSSALAAQSLLLVTLKSGIDDPQLASVRHTAVASTQDLALVRIPVGAAVEVQGLKTYQQSYHTLHHFTPTHPINNHTHTPRYHTHAIRHAHIGHPTATRAELFTPIVSP